MSGSSEVRCHVAPASSERNMPPSAASTIAKTRLGLAPETLTPILPIGLAGSPALPVSSVHVVPPSVDLNSPLESPPLTRSHGWRKACHSDAYSTCGFDGSIARSTAPVCASRNSTFCHDWPPFVDRNTPRSRLGPNACPSAATYTRPQSVGSTRILPIICVSSSPRCVQVSPPSVVL